MAYDINHCRFSGKLQDVKRVQTRTGTPMASFKLQCWKEQVRCVGFMEVAGQILAYNDGDRVEISGKIQSSNWEKNGTKVYSYQLIIDEIKADTNQKAQPANPEPVASSRKPQQQVPPPDEPDPHGLSEFDAAPVGEVPF